MRRKKINGWLRDRTVGGWWEEEVGMERRGRDQVGVGVETGEDG